MWTVFGANILTGAGANTILNDSTGLNGVGGININFNPVTKTTLSASASSFTFAGNAADNLTNNGVITAR